jgi:hypothetical protein
MRSASIPIARSTSSEAGLGGDAVAEDVDRLGLALEPRRQLLGDEDVGAVGDLLDAGDRVVIGDRHEVHPATLGQLVDLLGRVAHSGRPSARWTPSFESCEAVEWQCRSALLVARMFISLQQILLETGDFCEALGKWCVRAVNIVRPVCGAARPRHRGGAGPSPTEGWSFVWP